MAKTNFIENKLIDAGVRNLQEFGYPGCTKDNILTDMIYSAFFKNMLESNLGKGFDQEIRNLMRKLPKK